MSGYPYIPPITPYLLPREPFDAVIGKIGQRLTWMKAHTCPCTYAGGSPNGRLPLVGSAEPACSRCFGIGTYWDAPSAPFPALLTFLQGASPSPTEPGVIANEQFGPIQSSDPTVTIPWTNPAIPNVPNVAWLEASITDIFVAVDSLTRYTAVLQQGKIEALPYQQNLVIASTGAVTIYDTNTHDVVTVVGYTTSGVSVLLPADIYPDGTNYMVEFLAAPLYVAFRPAGAAPHVRAFGSGVVNLPRRFRLQTLDLWTRERMGGDAVTYSQNRSGVLFPQMVMSGQVVSR